MIFMKPVEVTPVLPCVNVPAVAPPPPACVNFAGAMVIAGGLVVWPTPPEPPPPPTGMATETGAVLASEEFANLAELASGGLEFRLVIEGEGVIFVTNEDMAGTDPLGRTVVPGLSRDGIGFSERVYLAEAEHESSIDSVTVEEVGGEWLGVATRVFSTIARRVVGLTQTLGVGGTMKIPHGSSSLLTVGERYYLGTETVKVESVDVAIDPDAPDEVVLTRGEWGSTAQEHPVATGPAAMVTSLYDAPTGFHGRRVWLYAHTANELSPIHEGTCVWRGLLSREPTLSDDVLGWSLGIEPRTRALEASIAGGYDRPFQLRGIYYAGRAPLRIRFDRLSGASLSDSSSDIIIVSLSGFFETQDAFAAALKAAIDVEVAAAAWPETFTVRAYPDTWDLLYTTTGTPRYIRIATGESGSHVDGWFRGPVTGDPWLTAPGEPAGEDIGLVGTVSASTTYLFTRDWSRERTVPVADQRRVPRSSNIPFRSTSDSAAAVAMWPQTRLYLADLGSLAAGDELTIAGATDEFGSPVADDVSPQVVVVGRVLSSVGAVEAAEWLSVLPGETLDASTPPRVLAGGETQPTITGTARYAGGDGDLADLRDDLVTRAPVLANRGKAPWITNDDIADWHAAVTEAAAGRAWLDHRAWSFAKPVKAIEVLQAELKLYGLIPHLDANGRLAVRPFTAGGTAIELAIGPDQQLVDEGLGNVSGEADGLYTVVNVKTGYDPVEDEHVGREIVYRGLEAIARVHEERVLEIAPMSRAVGAEPDELDLFDRGRSIISLFGDRRTQVVTLEVTLECFDLLIGDTVSLTIPQLPSDGHRTEWSPGQGMIARVGTLIGRSWDLANGAGELTVLLHELDLAGYAPSAKVTGAGGSGTSWTLQVAERHYSAGTDSSYFADGMSVRLVEWGSSSPTIREGVVTGTPGATSIVVTLSSAWSGMGSATRYTLLFDSTDDAQTIAAQLDYAANASAAGRIPVAVGTSPPAQTFAP